jgi:lipopolysaccharide export system permease protein
MRILDNYTTKSIAQAFISSIFLFLFLYILIDLATHLDDFFSNKVPPMVILHYYTSFLPVIFVQTSPIACLLATLFTYSTLNNNNEIIALRASGLNFWQITRPAIIFGLVATALVFMVNERFVPQSVSMSQDIKMEKIERGGDKKANKPPPIKYLFFYGLGNRLFFIDQYDPSTKIISGITIIAQDERQRMTEKITALKAEWTPAGWKFSNCQVTKYNPLDQSISGDLQFFKEKVIAIEERPEDLMKQKTAVSAMNIRQLKSYIKRFKASGAVVALNSLKVDLHQRIAYPFACVVIILVGLPFALTTKHRKGLTFASVGIALMIGFLFFVVNSVGLALGKGGALPPVTAAWFAPAIFLISGVYLSRKLF